MTSFNRGAFDTTRTVGRKNEPIPGLGRIVRGLQFATLVVKKWVRGDATVQRWLKSGGIQRDRFKVISARKEDRERKREGRGPLRFWKKGVTEQLEKEVDRWSKLCLGNPRRTFL